MTTYLKTGLREVMLIFILVNICSIHISAQDVEEIGSEINSFAQRLENDPLRFSGGINAIAGFNAMSGIDRRFSPFNWRLSARINVDFLGIKAPLSANISSGNRIYNYSLPPFKLPSYAIIGISPKYKWATVHLGDRSMDFSRYSLAGHSFRGVGVELKPGKFRFAAMYGRLRRAVAEDLVNLQALDPSYKRIGWGVKTGYDNGEDNIYAIIFSAKDDPNSIPQILEDIEATPGENTIFSLQGKKTLGKLYVGGEFAFSAYTRDANSPQLNDPSEISIFKRVGGLFDPRSSSTYQNAFNLNFGIKTNFGNIEMGYERIDPFFRTMGALFFRNDFENITASTRFGLFEKKVNVFFKGGLERNNIEDTEQNSNNRFIGAVNATYSPNQTWNISAAYSNFKNTNKIRAVSIPFVQIDSIILALTNQNINFGVTRIGGEEKNKVSTAVFTYQQSNSIFNDEIQSDQTTSNYMGMLSHAHTFTGNKLTLTGTMLANIGNYQATQVVSLAPTIGVSKKFFSDKMDVQGNLSYVKIYTESANINDLISLGANIGYQMGEKQTLGFRSSLIHRNTNGEQLSSDKFTEWVGSLNYGFRF